MALWKFLQHIAISNAQRKEIGYKAQEVIQKYGLAEFGDSYVQGINMK